MTGEKVNKNITESSELTTTKNTTNKPQKRITVDALEISEKLGFTIHRKTNRVLWTEDEDQKVLNSVDEMVKNLGYARGLDYFKENPTMAPGVLEYLDWDLISKQHFPNNERRRGKDIKKRWNSTLDPNLKRGKWSKEEDDLLLKTYTKYGPHWLKISKEIPGRNEDQCSKRYVEALDPKLSEGRLRSWSLEEDLLLISMVKEHGTKWRTISMEMQSRPSLTCRNRWRKIITSVIRKRASKDIMEAVKNTGASLESIELGLNKTGQRKPANKEVNGLCKEDNVMSVRERKHLLDTENNDMLDGRNNDTVSKQFDKKKQQHFPTYKKEKEKTHFTNKLDNTMPEPILSPESTQTGKKLPRSIKINQNRNTTTPSIDKTQVELLNKSPSPNILDYKSQKCFVKLPEITKQTSPIDNDEESYTNTDSNNHTPGLTGHKNLTAKNKGENKTGNTIIGNISPKPDKMQWKYTLKDNMGYSLSNGIISSSELVNELIMEAKKNNLKISIHQHIHNHYGNHGNNTGTTDILFQSNETSPESINAGSTNNSINFIKNNTHANHETNLITGASPLASLDHLDGNNGFTSLTTTQFPQPTFPVSRPPSSLGGAPNTPKIMQDLQEMGISRHRHFKTLPPTVKPKLGSSDSSKLTDINRILNSNISNSRCRRKNERKRRVSDNTKLGSESEGNTPVSSISSTNSAANILLNTNIQGPFSEKRSKLHRIKSESKNISQRESRGSSSSHNLEEEEGPDFWESLRSLQPGPALNKDIENEDDSRLELFYQFFGPPETSSIYCSSAALNKKNMKVTEQTEDSEKGLDEDYLLPFNPS